MKKKRSTEEPVVEDDGIVLDDVGTKKSRRRGGTGLGRYILIAILATTFVTAAGGLTMGWLQFVKQKEIADTALAGEMARQHAHLVSAVVRQAQAQAQQLARGELVTSAFAQDREAQTAALLSQLVLDGVVTLVPADSLQLASGLSFTAREMLLKARKGERPAPAFLPGEVPVLLMAEPTESGGVLLLEQRLSVLSSLMQQQKLEGAWVTIKSADNQVIFSVGKPIEGQRGAVESAAGARAEAVVPPSAEDPALLMLYAIVAGGMILLVMVVIISTLMAVGRAIRKDSALLANLASDLTSHGQASTRDQFTFTPIELVTQSIRKLAEEGGAAGSTPARRKSAGAAGDEEDDSFIAVSGDNMAELTGDDEATVVMSQLGISVAEEIFREYDIRGVTGRTLTEEAAEAIGRAVGTESLQQGEGTVVLARDGRLSSPDIAEAVARGLLASGRDVIDIGQVPTPVMYYATKVLNATSGVMITGSHNPPEYNGIKVVVAGETLHGDRIRALHTRIERNEFSTGDGMRRSEDVLQRYLQDILADIVMARPMKIVVDTGNGVAGVAAPELFRQLGCDVEELFTDVDGTFPNHHPDTSKPENYATLIERVKQGGAEIGLAFDGDGDRLGVVTPAGEIIWPDRLMMLYAKDLLTRSPGADVIFDVKCSRELNRLISAQGGRPVMARTGHSLIKAKLKETGAPLAGEMSGHIFFADRWHGFDDGMYAGARLLEILSLEAGSADDVFAGYATGPCTPEITIPVPEDAKFAVVQKLQSMADQFSGNATTIDGLRVDFDDGWGLVRASNTTPSLVARFEGVDEAALRRIEEEFRNALQAISSNMKVPF